MRGGWRRGGRGQGRRRSAFACDGGKERGGGCGVELRCGRHDVGRVTKGDKALLSGEGREKEIVGYTRAVDMRAPVLTLFHSSPNQRELARDTSYTIGAEHRTSGRA